MMRMLEAGGIPPYFDGGDRANVIIGRKEYINLNVVLRETSRIRDLKIGNTEWLTECHGKALKNLDPCRNILPMGLEYKFIYMDRDLKAMVKSQRKFAESYRGLNPLPEDDLYQINREMRKKSLSFLGTYPGSVTLRIGFEFVLKKPKAAAVQVENFLGRKLDIEKMAGVVVKRTPANYKGFLEEKIYMTV